MPSCTNSSALNYSSPAHGGGGLVRMGLMVPESHELFVCPFACGRHGAIAAIHHGYKDRVSYLYIDEADIVSGGYEDLILEAVDELLEALGYHPKVLMIIVSCLDDLLGTDHDAFLRMLREKYPHMRFTVGHMNPISLDGKLPPPINIQCKMYGLLEKRSQNPNAVNLVGNISPISKHSELCRTLEEHGYSVRQIGWCESFDDFLQMGESCLNIVTIPSGLQAAKQMQLDLGIDYIYLPLAHDVDEMDGYYKQLFAKLLWETPANFDNWHRSLSEKAAQILSIVGDREVSVDHSSTIRPFSLAKTLVRYGFSVREVLANECPPLEESSLEWLRKHTSAVWLNPNHYTAVKRPHNPETLSVGFESGYYNSSQHAVGLVECEGLYGYHGLEQILDMMAVAAQATTDVKKMIAEYGLVV